jgi:enoyl-CoA hydratase/carnithine racemase
VSTRIIRKFSSTSAAAAASGVSVKRIAPNVDQLELTKSAMDLKFWGEFASAVDGISKDPTSRCIVLSSASKAFSFGLDVKDKSQMAIFETKSSDPARKADTLRRFVSRLQGSFTSLEQAPPVIACVHSYCIGGAIDLICVADIRYCTKDASFSIKEVDVGLCPDLGTLQRIERIVRSSSVVRELAFTGRQFSAEEALQIGFVSRVFENKDSMMQASLELAKTIAEKSPVAISGIKENLNFSRGRPVEDALKYQAVWSSAALQATDVEVSLAAAASGGRGPIKLQFKDLPK